LLVLRELNDKILSTQLAISSSSSHLSFGIYFILKLTCALTFLCLFVLRESMESMEEVKMKSVKSFVSEREGNKEKRRKQQ
jgi:hypothetical protein